MKNNTLKKILVFSMLVVAVLACAALFVVVIDVVRKDSGIISDIDMSSDHIDGEEADQNTTDTADSSDDLVTDDNVFTFSEADRKYYNTDTLIKVNTFDYYSDSITGLSDTMYTEEEMYRVLEEKGAEFAGTCGMPLDEYQDAMNRKWTDCTEYDQEVITTDFSLSEKYHYTDIVETMKILSRHEGVYLYDIGETT
ncbi:MAG: hypothetical protein J5824_08830, partial [Lachnospiraceae bacterium]|nr:hypothetical protein [Lachnospiraceae bacterium]